MEQITLDIIPSGVRENAYASQYDNGRTIRFNLKSGGATYTLTGAETVTMRVRKPDGTERTESITNTSSTYVDWTTINGTCDLDGLYDCELVVMNGSVKIGSANFTLNAEVDPYSGKVVIKMATGNPVHFETDLDGVLVDCKCNLPYNADGYTSATVINSKTTPVIDQTPYQTRLAPSSIGNLALEKVVGLSVCFNQLVEPKNTTNTSYTVQCVFTTDGKATLNGTASGGTSTFTTLASYNAIQGHKYLLKGGLSNDIWCVVSNVSVWGTQNRFDYGGGIILNATASGTIGVNIQVAENHACNNDVVMANFIDLTAMFGSTVADYLYTLESGTAGAGVNLFKTLFAEEYYPYTANTLMSCKPTSKVIVGKNLIDINNCLDDYFISSGNMKITSIEGASVFYCKVPINTTLTLTPNKSNRCVIMGYYSEPETLPNSVGDVLIVDSASGITSRTFSTGDCSFLCIYLSRTADYKPTQMQLELGSTPTAYEPYSQTTITLSGNELRGLLKVGTNGLYADGDTDDGSGMGEVRYGIIDLSACTWYSISGNRLKTNDTIGLSKPAINTEQTNLIAQNYINAESNYWLAEDTSRKGYISMSEDGGTVVRLKDGELSATGYLVYELATPTTQTLTAWNNPIKACEGGTEEFTDTRTIKLPTGHDTVYGTDLIAKTADFGTTVYGGSFDFTTGELISDKNADGTDKAPETISLTPMTVPARSGDNYIITDADGSNSVKYFDAI